MNLPFYHSKDYLCHRLLIWSWGQGSEFQLMYHFTTSWLNNLRISPFYHLTVIPFYHSIILPFYKIVGLPLSPLFEMELRSRKCVPMTASWLNNFTILWFYHFTTQTITFATIIRYGAEVKKVSPDDCVTLPLHDWTILPFNYYTILPFYHFTTVQLYCFINYLCHRHSIWSWGQESESRWLCRQLHHSP